MGLIYVILLVLLVVFIVKTVSEGEAFKSNSNSLKMGMTKNEVISIMGNPSYQTSHQDGSYTLVYEKSEWKGIFRGGTRTRKIELVFSAEDKVISIGKNSDCNMPGW